MDNSNNNNAIDFAKLALPQDFEKLCKTSSRPSTLHVKRPGKQQFFRVCPDDGWSIPCAIFEDESTEGAGQKYFVAKAVYETDAEFRDLCYPVSLLFCCYRGGTYFLWPCKLPTGGAGDSWHSSGQLIAKLARDKWVRMKPNQGESGYDYTTPDAAMEEPIWPTEWNFNDALNIAFRGRVITSTEHDIVLQKKGLA